MAANGMSEIISCSFMDEKIAESFREKTNKYLRVLNPIVKDFNYMRPSIIPNLLKIAKSNQDRLFSIFEKGNIFEDLEEDKQKFMISGIRTGLTSQKSIFKDSREYDVYDVKKYLYEII